MSPIGSFGDFRYTKNPFNPKFERQMMSGTCRYKFLVIDDQDLLEISNLTRKVNQAIKHPEPVVKMDAPWDTDDDVFDLASVVYDEADGLFKMWYQIYTVDSRREYGPSCPAKMAYAFSSDGLNWEKPILNRLEINGTMEHNFVTPEMGNFSMSVLIDPSDPSERRFKMMFLADSGFGSGGETDWAKFHVPLCIAYSPDGIHWDRPVHVNPVLRGVSDGIFALYYDEDRRKYVLFSRRVPNLPRDISQYESYDLVNWEDKGRVLVAGDEFDSRYTTDLHAFSPVRYEQFHLAVINTMYTLPESESYSVFQKPPADYPNQMLGTMDLQLAYSRDGQNWSRPNDRSPVVALGPAGSPDGGFIFPINNPIVRDGDTWIYYSSRCRRHNDWDLHQSGYNVTPRNEGFGMLAKMPEDHWVSLDADNNEGSFVCKPWGPPHEIFVNADAQGGSIEAELVTPYGKVVPDYSRNDCIAATASGKNQQIKWKNGKSAWESIAKDHRGGLLMKFYLKNAKLYSYTFTLPDADGQLERDRVNARWCEHIKHRSGNWGRNSNEPATGRAALPTTS
jgi:hypothetical protein